MNSATEVLDCQLYTQIEAAQILAVCPKTVYNLTRQGLLPVVRLTQRIVRYKRADLEAFTKQRTEGIPATA
ncbi:helix-turn-helix domain-containing protein [Planctomycetales bacterium ZRK34]|nr:helix-turn-helix domain-containing protein [Planctomycetales bacterium ZRK34]